MEDQAAWSVIHKAWGISGQKSLRILLEESTAAEIWQSPEAVLSRLAVEAPAEFVGRLEQLKRSVDLEHISSNMGKFGIRIVDYNAGEYPEKLKYIYNPPALLYVKGQLPPPEQLAIAVVGSRKCTEYGRKVARELAGELAKNGCAIISGLARGIDAASHEGALEAEGCTAAVLGCGVDKIYPRENKGLYQRIQEQGQSCILSELPLGSEPLKHHFPLRNRIISGLCDGLLVVEAAIKSGALITAELALEQGKEIFSVPGPITSALSAGTHKLIKDGAKITTGAEDILEEFGQLCLFKEEKVQDNDVSLGNNEKKVLECISIEPIAIEEVARMTKLPIDEVMALLSWLEINGMIQQIVGRKYIRLC